jgi:predicted dehydrogenase
MSTYPTHDPIGVGAVGTHPSTDTGPLAEMPGGGMFQLVAYSDEGSDQPEAEHESVPYYPDYNVLLEDSAVELVVVEGPLERRRDFAVRALNAGRNVLLQEPFCETALDAERVMKTAFHTGLVATMSMPWRDDVDLRALQRALREENVGRVHGLHMFWAPPADVDFPRDGLLPEYGVDLLDQVNMVVDQDVGEVRTHALRAAPGRPDEGFTLYLSLRGGGCAVLQAGRYPVEEAPRWLVTTRGATFAVREGVARVAAGEQRREYSAPAEPDDFWENLYAAVRDGAELKCHPVEIVRAMKLYEGALESAETGQAAVI